MRVVVPYTKIDWKTEQSLRRFVPSAERVPMTTGESYWELFSGLWSKGQSFVLIEHDVVIHKDVIPALQSCPEPWCGFPYSGGHALFYEGLGCARFSHGLIQELPSLPDDIGRCRWNELDWKVAGELRAKGHQIHTHLPAVRHFHRWARPEGHMSRCRCPTCDWVRTAEH